MPGHKGAVQPCREAEHSGIVNTGLTDAQLYGAGIGVATGSKRYCDDPTPSVAGASTPKSVQLPRKKLSCSVPLYVAFSNVFCVEL